LFLKKPELKKTKVNEEKLKSSRLAKNAGRRGRGRGRGRGRSVLRGRISKKVVPEEGKIVSVFPDSNEVFFSFSFFCCIIFSIYNYNNS
jgi:hypothetical protein